MRKKSDINFNKCLSRGYTSYNARVGQWWHNQSENMAHRRAYKNMAEYFLKMFQKERREPRYILDYACGNGAFLYELARKFPNTKLVGVDGSTKMLKIAKNRFESSGFTAELLNAGKCFINSGPRVRLLQTLLPNFSIPKGKVDAAVFLFPNMTCAPKERARYERHGFNNPKDSNVAEMLSRFREMDPEDEVTAVPFEEMYADLMTNKVISRNLRHILKKGGKLLRSEYANAPREELTDLTNWRTLFTEGALETPVKGDLSEMLFRFKDSYYRRSSVILDVYDQTGDPTDKTGGYYCSVLEAV